MLAAQIRVGIAFALPNCRWRSVSEAGARFPNAAAASIVAAVVTSLTSAAGATVFQGPLEISGNVESQTLARHSQIDEFQFIQNRNTLRLGVEWDWVQAGRLGGRFTVPGISDSGIVLLYRGVYDSFYDASPGGTQHGQERTDDLIGGTIEDLPERTLQHDLRFDNDLRKAYIDLQLEHLPLRLRLGRQEVVWGESDYFRLMDIWNPLDVRWHFHQEPRWEEIRTPLWLLKGVWDFDSIGPLSDVYAEVVYNPGDYKPAIISDFLPRPWALPFPDPLRSGQVQYDSVTGLHLSPVIDLQGTSTRQGDFHRNPAEASEVGLRFHAVTPQGIDFSLNYFYGRGRGVGAALPFAVDIESVELPSIPGLGGTPVGTYQIDAANPASAVPVFPINVRAEVVHPYMHIFGLTAKYFDADITGTSFRTETAYVLGSPFHTIEPGKLVPVRIVINGREIEIPGLDLPTAPLGFTKRDLWAGMIGFDRPSWIRALNKESAWVFTGQLFWTYVVGGDVDELRGNAGTSEEPYFGSIGRWTEGPFAGQAERQQDGRLPGNSDQIRRWELLFTLAATSAYWNGRLVPLIANVYDPVNRNDAVIWSLDYFLRNDVIISLTQRFFTDFGADFASNDPWFLGGRMHRRDETGIKITYQY
jgi:hypothetical protein